MWCRIKECRPPSSCLESHYSGKHWGKLWQQWDESRERSLPKETAWWISFSPLETVLKIHQYEVSGNRPTSCPGRSKKTKAFYCILVEVPTSPEHVPSLSTCKTNPSLPDANNVGRVHQSTWARMDRQKDGWTKRTGKRESRTSIFIYKREFWPSRGKW